MNVRLEKPQNQNLNADSLRKTVKSHRQIQTKGKTLPNCCCEVVNFSQHSISARVIPPKSDLIRPQLRSKNRSARYAPSVNQIAIVDPSAMAQSGGSCPHSGIAYEA